MLDVLKARWQTRGWHAMEKGDSEPMAIAFIRELNRHKIPYAHYMELYRRAVDLRSRRLEQGLSCDDFSVDMMIACWPALSRELHQRDVDSGRFIPETAASQCQRCFGLGLENIYDDEGNHLGTRKGCQHKPIEEGEGISIKMRRDHAAAEVIGDAEPTIDTAIAAIEKFKVRSADELLRDLCIKLRRQSLSAPESPIEAHEWHTEGRWDDECEHCLIEAWKKLNRARDYVLSVEAGEL